MSAAVASTSNARARASPAVVLQSGLGESSSYWGRIAPAVAASTTVCAYDRAGHGRSDEAAAPQDGIALATDLHTLLERAGVPGPYVLVGHSSGGPYVRVFAARYPDQVAGHGPARRPAGGRIHRAARLPDASIRSFRTVYSLSPSLARIGLLGPILGLPADQSTPAAARGARDEIVALPAALQQALAFTSLGDRPLIVVTAGSGQQAGWLEAQDRLARPLHEQQPPRPSGRHPHLAHQRRRRRGVQPGDPRRRVLAPDRDGRPMNAPPPRLLLFAAVLFLGMAAFQTSLALGAPLGAYVLGGRHPGGLPNRLRFFSAMARASWWVRALILARAGAVGWPAGCRPADAGVLGDRGFLVLNTLGNLASKSRLERTVFAATTAGSGRPVRLRRASLLEGSRPTQATAD